MEGTGATLLVAGAAFFAVSLFALSHRRDALGAALALMVGFGAVACVLVGFSELAQGTGPAAQMQAFAVVTEITGALFAAVLLAAAAVLRRRNQGLDPLEELAPVGPPPSEPLDAGPFEEAQPEPQGESAPEAEEEAELSDADGDVVTPEGEVEPG